MNKLIVKESKAVVKRQLVHITLNNKFKLNFNSVRGKGLHHHSMNI